MKWGLACAVLVALSLLSTSAGAVPKSLFIQVSSIPYGANGQDAWITRSYLHHVCAAHKTPGSSDYIYDLALTEIADANGKLYGPQLDLIAEYFPCFNNVFVGSVALPWTGMGSAYVEGMKDTNFRWANINVSNAVAAAFIQKFPNLVFHWYISYEANLNYLANDATLLNDYIAYLLQLTTDLHNKRSAAILWSPTFWSHASQVNASQLQTALAKLFSSVPLLTWVHFQDFVGQSAKTNGPGQPVQYDFTCQDAISYYNILRSAGPNLASLGVNMELFVSGYTGGIYPGQRTEQAARAQCYANAGILIGASWELRWWYLSDHGSPDTTCQTPEICDGPADHDCDDNVGACDAGTAGHDSGSAGDDSGSSGGDSGSSVLDGGSEAGAPPVNDAGTPAAGLGGCQCAIGHEELAPPLFLLLALEGRRLVRGGGRAASGDERGMLNGVELDSFRPTTNLVESRCGSSKAVA